MQSLRHGACLIMPSIWLYLNHILDTGYSRIVLFTGCAFLYGAGILYMSTLDYFSKDNTEGLY